MSTDDRLERQIRFILEIDRLKNVLRQNMTTAGRPENSCEHSWHITVMAVLLGEHANERIDLLRVLKMLLVHDVVEIDAGDTYCYDLAAAAGQAQRERAAAERIFGLLPPDQGDEMRRLWEEFEQRRTPEARFAAAMDRLQPVLLNYFTQGEAWRRREVTNAQVMARNRTIGDGAARLWEYARGLIEDAARKGYIVGDADVSGLNGG